MRSYRKEIRPIRLTPAAPGLKPVKPARIKPMSSVVKFACKWCGGTGFSTEEDDDEDEEYECPRCEGTGVVEICLTEDEIGSLIGAVHYARKDYPDENADNAIVKMELAIGSVHSSDNDCTLDKQDVCRVCHKNHNVIPCWNCGKSVYRDPESCKGCTGVPDPSLTRLKLNTEQVQRRTLQIAQNLGVWDKPKLSGEAVK